MVCSRCITAVESIFKDLNIQTVNVCLGEVEIKNSLSRQEIYSLNDHLNDMGFEFLENSTKQIIEKVKNAVILNIQEIDIPEDFILSEFLSKKLHKEYSAISKTFSQNEGITLEQYFILQKIEKAKELLIYNEFSLTEISIKLGYKSVQDLSSQFKNTTGFTPSAFKKLKEKPRKSLDKI